jgi:hypothetical protein
VLSDSDHSSSDWEPVLPQAVARSLSSKRRLINHVCRIFTLLRNSPVPRQLTGSHDDLSRNPRELYHPDREHKSLLPTESFSWLATRSRLVICHPTLPPMLRFSFAFHISFLGPEKSSKCNS